MHGWTHAVAEGRKELYGWCFLAYALSQTAGLLTMACVVNVDCDLHMRQRPILAAGISLVMIVYSFLKALQLDGTMRLVSETRLKHCFRSVY